MALSSSKDYTSTYTAANLVAAALRKIGMLDVGETIDSTEQANALEALNLIVKEISPWADLWLREEQTLFLVADQKKYLLGTSTTDNFTADLIETTVSSGTGTSLTVASATGILSGDVIGIKLDDNTVQWTTVNGAPAGNVITLTASLTTTVTSGNPVYTYTTRANRPNRILTAWTRSVDNIDLEITPIGRVEYQNLSMKGAEGTPTQYHYNPALGTGELFVWPVSQDPQTDKIVLVSQLLADDLDAVSNNLQFPPEWHNYLVWQLAFELAPEYDISMKEAQGLLAVATMKKQDLLDNDIEHAGFIIERDTSRG